MSRKGDYGYDAPYILIIFALGVVGSVGLLVVGTLLSNPWLTSFSVWGIAIDAICGLSFLYATRVGKHVVWERLVDDLALRGDETVVDVGCGRGAVLLLAATRLPSGKAIGIDIWSAMDQSGNAELATRRNAELEGVIDRVELVTADMRAIPLPDASVDVIVSSLAIHNIPSAAERSKALAEILRVLRPGGRFTIVDIQHARSYATELERLGATVTRRGLGPRLWFGGPFVAASAVIGTKP